MAEKKKKKEDVTFSIINEETVERLEKDGEVHVPKKKISIPKDKQWNTKQMGSKLLQGIRNGDSVDKMAESLKSVIGNNLNSAVRNARTMTTSAENNGRLDSYKKLEKDGIVQHKVWMSTPDDRTRQSHLEIDGEEQEINDLFSNGCAFPGDGNGPAEEVWMCRCTMYSHIIGFRKPDGTISLIDYEPDETSHDRQMTEERTQRLEKQIKTIKETMFPTKAQQSYADELVKEYREKSGFTNPEDYVKKYKGLSADEYAEMKLASMPDKANDEIKEAYRELVKTEKETTAMMKDVASKNGFELRGLDARLKEGDSFMRKVDTRVKMRGMSYSEAAKTVEDGCRYTIISGKDSLVKDYNSVVDLLSKNGYTVKSIENNFTDPNLAMNNLAVYFKSPNDSTVEVWFHTEQTYNMLGENHKYYEAIRVRGDWNDEGSQALGSVLYKGYYDGIEMPKDISTIKATERWGK